MSSPLPNVEVVQPKTPTPLKHTEKKVITHDAPIKKKTIPLAPSLIIEQWLFEHYEVTEGVNDVPRQ